MSVVAGQIQHILCVEEVATTIAATATTAAAAAAAATKSYFPPCRPPSPSSPGRHGGHPGGKLNGRPAAHIAAGAAASGIGRRRRRGRRGLLLPPGRPPRAEPDPEGDPGDHGQDPRRRGHCGDRARLEVRRHGARPTLPHHLHRLHHRRHHCGPPIGAAHHRHLVKMK